MTGLLAISKQAPTITAFRTMTLACRSRAFFRELSWSHRGFRSSCHGSAFWDWPGRSLAVAHGLVARQLRELKSARTVVSPGLRPHSRTPSHLTRGAHGAMSGIRRSLASTSSARALPMMQATSSRSRKTGIAKGCRITPFTECESLSSNLAIRFKLLPIGEYRASTGGPPTRDQSRLLTGQDVELAEP